MEVAILKIAETQVNVLKALASRQHQQPNNTPLMVFGIIVILVLLFVWWDRQDRRMYISQNKGGCQTMETYNPLPVHKLDRYENFDNSHLPYSPSHLSYSPSYLPYSPSHLSYSPSYSQNNMRFLM